MANGAINFVLRTSFTVIGGSHLLTRHRITPVGHRREGTVLPLRANQSGLLAARADDDVPVVAAGKRNKGLLADSDIGSIEKQYVDGITAPQIVEVFTSRGVKFSEASFRKYVQQGLLPRSRRVGRKGKFRGSLGIYPAKTVRRINSVKEWMADGYTIEEIQSQFLSYTDLVENLSEGLGELCTKLGTDASGLSNDSHRKALSKELTDLRRDSDTFIARVRDMTKRVVAPRTQTFRRSGAAGSAEDLL
jgi:hypothetical protein